MKNLLITLFAFPFVACVTPTYGIPYVDGKQVGAKKQLIWNNYDTVYSLLKYNVLKFSHKPKPVKTVGSIPLKPTAAAH